MGRTLLNSKTKELSFDSSFVFYIIGGVVATQYSLQKNFVLR